MSLQWRRNQLWPRLEEGCRKAKLGVWLGVWVDRHDSSHALQAVAEPEVKEQRAEEQGQGDQASWSSAGVLALVRAGTHHVLLDHVVAHAEAQLVRAGNQELLLPVHQRETERGRALISVYVHNNNIAAAAAAAAPPPTINICKAKNIWTCLGIYAHEDRSLRRQTWDLCTHRQILTKHR